MNDLIKPHVSLFCVQCRAEAERLYKGRCTKCAPGFTGPKKKTTILERSGMKFSHTLWTNYARFCKLCGGLMREPEYSSRVLRALQIGGECHTCDECFDKKKFPRQEATS